jgi:predicted phosphodiesterase
MSSTEFKAGWYTTAQASDITGRSPRTIRTYATDGKIKRKVQGRTVLFYIDEAFLLTLTPLQKFLSLDPIDGTESLTEADANHTFNMPAFDWDSSQPVFEQDEINAIIDNSGVESFLKYVKFSKRTNPVTVTPVTRIYDDEPAIKILSLSDIHFPFQNVEAINQAIIDHEDADVLVLNGDILDAYSASSYGKDKNVLLYEEYMQALDFLIRCSKIFPTIYLVRGNHDQRAERYVASKMDTATHILGNKDLLDMLARGIILDGDGKYIGQYKFAPDQIVYNKNHLPWYAKVGKTVFMHPHSYKGTIMGTSSGCLEHLRNFVPWDSFDSVVIGHTHKVGKVVESNKLLMEQGSLCSIMDYQKVGVTVRRPSSLGYAVIYQDVHGNTDFNLSTVEYCGTLQYIS